MASNVPATRSANKAQAFDDMSGRGAKEGVFDRFPQKINKRFSIERLKTLRVPHL